MKPRTIHDSNATLLYKYTEYFYSIHVSMFSKFETTLSEHEHLSAPIDVSGTLRMSHVAQRKHVTKYNVVSSLWEYFDNFA